MIINGLLTLLTLVGGIALVILFVIGLSLGAKWLDKKFGNRPVPKWLLKLDSIMEKAVAVMMSLILLGLLGVVFYSLYQIMWT